MIVMKFGGTTVGSSAAIRKVAEIVRASLARQPVVVSSAHSGVTDLLFEMANAALKGHVSLEQLRACHYTILDELGVDRSILDDLFNELEGFLRGVSLVKELTPRSQDFIVSYGERMAVKNLATHFNQIGIEAEPVYAYDLGLLTDSNFGSANALPEAYELIKENISKIKKLPIVTGYIGKNREGSITTLGRNGSDYSASIIGAAIDADEVQIWKDVDGVMTANPRLVRTAFPIEALSFDEASELAYFGTQVLHPSTIQPAIQKDIPIRVCNIYKPTNPGTLIVKESTPSKTPVKSIAYKKDLYILTIISTQMLMQAGFLARIFDVFDQYQIDIDMVATSEVSVSVTTDSAKNLDRAIKDLSQFAEVEVEEKQAIIGVVGEGIRTSIEIAGLVFNTMREQQVRVRMISVGATRINLAFIVANNDVEHAVEALHQTCFEMKEQ